MMRRSLIVSSLMFLVFAASCSNPQLASTATLADTVEVHGEAGVLSATVVQGRTGPGAEYEMWMPDSWNGTLILYAHGYIDPALPTGFPDELPAELAALRNALLFEGFAVAYSSYSEHGYALKDGVQRTHQLSGLFTRHFRRPQHTYLMGHSLGGMVVLAMAEQYQQYDGALSLCSFVGGGLMQTEYIANVRVLFDFFYPALSSALLPGDAVNVPPGLDFGAISAGIAAGIMAELLPNPLDPADLDLEALLKLLTFATIDQIRLPFDPTLAPTTQGAQVVESLLRALYYNVVGGHDLIERSRRSPFDNTGTAYSGPLLDPTATMALNATVARYSASRDAVNYLLRWYQPTGKLRMPVLTMHTTLDPDVPFGHQAVYAGIAAAAGQSHQLAQRAIPGYGHCNFTPVQTMTALSDLIGWTALGIPPVP
jgi:pimeloyl-ACP methyl ester carboxylesterase